MFESPEVYICEFCSGYNTGKNWCKFFYLESPSACFKAFTSATRSEDWEHKKITAKDAVI